MNDGFNNFIFYKEWLDQIRLLACSGDPEDVATLCDGLEAFLDGDDMADMTPMATLVYNQMTAQICRDKKQYEEISLARSEAGKRGAEAKRSKRKQTEANVSKPKQTEANASLKEDDDEDDDVSPKGDVLDVCAEPLIGLPLNDGSEHPVTEEDVEEYHRLYPAVDVMQQLRNMRGWLLANPARKKTRRGIRAFISTWLQKEQDHPTARSGTTTRKMTAEEIFNLPAINPWSEVSP